MGSIYPTVFDKRYYEDFALDETFETAGRTITESDVMAFAGLTGDYHPNHTDDVVARQSMFGGRVAHGLLIVSIASGLLLRAGLTHPSAMGMLDVRWKFHGPVRLGDTVRARMRIASARTTSKPDRGIITRAVEVVNQDGVVVSEGEFTSMVWRDPERTVDVGLKP